MSLVNFRCSPLATSDFLRLVVELGLKSNLSEYKVPTQDIPGIAAAALGRGGDSHLAQVVKLLEGLYD